MLALLGTNKIWTFAVSNIDKFVGYFKEEDGKFRQYYNGTVPNPLGYRNANHRVLSI